MSEDLDLSQVGISYWLDLLAWKNSVLSGANDVSKPRHPLASVRARDDEAELALIEARRFNQDVERLVGRKIQEAHRAAGTDEYVLSDGTPVELGAVTSEHRKAYLAGGKSIVDLDTRDA
jgi:hypothetical protein